MSTDDLLREYCSRNNINYDGLDAPDARPWEQSYVFHDFSSSGPTALEITRLGRFGNSYIRMCNALKIAIALDIKTILVPDNEIWKWDGPRGDGIHLVPVRDKEGPKTPGTLAGSFLHALAFRKMLNLVKPQASVEITKTYLRPCLADWLTPREDLDESTIVLHFRSGDVFQKGPREHLARASYVPAGYVQPPHAYYMACLDHHLKTFPNAAIILAFECRGNPCIDSVEQEIRHRGLPWQLQSADLVSDLSLLFKAATVAWGYGSFGPAISLLSSKIRRCYWYENHPSGKPVSKRFFHEWKVLGLGVTHIFDDGAGYIKVGTWSNSEDQRRLMVEYPGENLTLKESLKPSPHG